MSNTTLSICILSGKGGVGKTNITLNLAYALHQMALPSLLMDCDMGLANIDVLLGITPEKTMQDALLGHCDINEVFYTIDKIGNSRLDLLPAASGMPELVELDADKRERLLKLINPLLSQYHYVFMDLGAGITDMVQAFAMMASVRIVIVTPEPTSLTDCYALIKILYTNHGVRDFFVLVNQVETTKDEKQTFDCLFKACQKFLGVEPILLGSVRYDNKLIESVRQQEPLLSYAKGAPAAVDIESVAKKIQKLRLNMLNSIADRNVLHISAE